MAAKMTHDPLASLSGAEVQGELGSQSQARPIRASYPGKIAEVLGSGLFRVSLPDEQQVVAHLSGGMRLLTARLIPGDRVAVEISPYDPSRGRIVRRLGGD